MSTIDRPTVLLVGAGERMKDALAAALERHHLMVEWVLAEQAVDAAFAAAPDMLVLLGDAAENDGRPVLVRLSQTPATATIPIVLLSSEPGVDKRVEAFRHGVVAVVPRTASADGMARRLAQLARELPERPGETAGELGDASIDDLIALFSHQLRTGILSVSAADDEAASAQVVLRAGRPVTDAIEELVARLKPLVRAQSGPLRFEFHESTSARLSLFDGDDESEPADESALRERRILLVEQNPARADVLVQELRAHRALVVVVDGQGTGLERARSLDPEVVIIDGSGVDGWALPTLRALRRDPRLRWASLLVVDAAELWPTGAAGPDVGRLATSMMSLVRADQELMQRAASGESFDTRLEVIGPSRVLRALTRTGLGLRLTIGHPRVRVEVDLAEGLVAGARALAPATGREVAKGPAALAALMAIGSGRVRVERKEAPASADIMAPVDDALAAAGRERAPIRPSIPPASSSEPPRGVKPAAAQSPDRLIGRLEELLERLQTVLPAAEAAAAAGAPATAAIPPPSAQAPPNEKPSIPKPPGGALPPSGQRRRATLMLGSAEVTPPQQPQTQTQPQPGQQPQHERDEEEDDDIPVIEATAEPGVRGRSRPPGPSVEEPHRFPRPAPLSTRPPPSSSKPTVPRPEPARSLPRAALPARRTAPSATERALAAAPSVSRGASKGASATAPAAPLAALLEAPSAVETTAAAPFVLVAQPPPATPIPPLATPIPPLATPVPISEPAREPTSPPVASPSPEGREPSPSVEPPWLASVELDAEAAPSADSTVLPPETLEPYGVEAAFPPALRPPAHAEPAPTPVAPSEPPFAAPPKRGMPLLWIAVTGLLGLVLAAGAGVAYLVLGRDEPAPDQVVSLPRTPIEGPPTSAAAAMEAADARPEPGGLEPEEAMAPPVEVEPPVDAVEPPVQAAEPLEAVEPPLDAVEPDAVDPPVDAVDPPVEAVDPPSPPPSVDPTPALDEGESSDDEDEETGGGRGRRERQVAQLIRLANYQRNANDLATAEGNYIRALELDRGNARALAGLVRLNLARGTSEGAVRWARRLVAARPRNASNHVLLGDALDAGGSRRAAIAAWRHALELSPNLASARSRLANAR